MIVKLVLSLSPIARYPNMLLHMHTNSNCRSLVMFHTLCPNDIRSNLELISNLPLTWYN